MNVLWVDDEHHLIKSFVEAVRSAGNWNIVKVENARAAEDELCSDSKKYDLVLIDRLLRTRDMPSPGNENIDGAPVSASVLPDGRGLEGDVLLERIISQHPDICAIMLTNHSGVESAKAATQLGAYDYLEKRCKLPEIIAAGVRGVRSARIHSSRDRFLSAQTTEDVLQTAQVLFDHGNGGLSFCILEQFSPNTVLLKGCSGKYWEGVRLADVADPDLLNCNTSRLLRSPEAGNLAPTLDGIPLFRNMPVFVEAIISPVVSKSTSTRPTAKRRALCIFSTVHGTLTHRERRAFDELSNYVGEAYDRLDEQLEIRATTSSEGAKFVLDVLATAWPFVAGGKVRIESVIETSRIHSNTGATLRPEETNTLLAAHRLLQNAMDYISYLRIPVQDSGSPVPNCCPVLEVVQSAVQAFSRDYMPTDDAGDLPSISINKTASVAGISVSIPAEILSNAVRSMLQNSCEAICRRREQGDSTHGEVLVRLSADRKCSAILLSVVDNGVGIEAKHVPRLFERGFTTKKLTLSSLRTLGLHRLRELVKSYGGTLEGGPAVRGGAEFALVLRTAESTANIGASK